MGVCVRMCMFMWEIEVDCFYIPLKSKDLGLLRAEKFGLFSYLNTEVLFPNFDNFFKIAMEIFHLY